jgi:hypothetical protein
VFQKFFADALQNLSINKMTISAQKGGQKKAILGNYAAN